MMRATWLRVRIEDGHSTISNPSTAATSCSLIFSGLTSSVKRGQGIEGATALKRATKSARGLDLIGADLVEVSPPFDQSGSTALIGVTMMFEILCLLAERVAARRAMR